MVSRRSFWISCLVAIFGLANLAAAQGFRHSNRLVSITSHPTVTQGTCGPTDITESGSDTVVALNSVSCNNGVAQFDNHYWRAFLLSDFGITGNLDVCDVKIGVEEATAGAVPVTGKCTSVPVWSATVVSRVPIGVSDPGKPVGKAWSEV